MLASQQFVIEQHLNVTYSLLFVMMETNVQTILVQEPTEMPLATTFLSIVLKHMLATQHLAIHKLELAL